LISLHLNPVRVILVPVINMKRKPEPEKHCLACGTKLERKRYNGRLEGWAAFARRSYCNQQCMAKGMTQDSPTLAALRKRAEKYRGKVCQECGATTNLGIHHVNSDPADNSPENLRTLCGTCHSRWHWQNGKQPWKRLSDCVVCGQPALKLDLCGKHYQRFRKHGDPCLTKRKIGLSWQLVKDLG